MFFQKIGIKIRENKVPYYAKSILRQLVPTRFYQKLFAQKLHLLGSYNQQYLTDRVTYYNKLNNFTAINDAAVSINKEMLQIKSSKAYRFDTFEHTRYFNNNLKANFHFGDVINVHQVPTIQKSRPVKGDNANAILLNLDKRRHFFFVNDRKEFSQKQDMLIGRGEITQPHRIRFMEMYFGHPLCDLGQVNKTGGRAEWLKPKISIVQHLDYKFILSLEGNDVATNLKWIMSSGSVAVMPEPKYETWFMEGRLIPDFHYIRIKDDYSDLEERLNYYMERPAKAKEITVNANQYVQQFLNTQQEKLIALLVLEKYFYHIGQLQSVSV